MSEDVRIVKQEGSPLIDFAVSDIELSLKEVGYKTLILPPSEVHELERGNSIIIGIPREIGWLSGLLKRREIEIPMLVAEGFSINVQENEGNGRTVIVTGYDQKGAMYGGLDVAEQLLLDGNMESIKGKTEAPFIGFRAIRYTMPLKASAGLEHWDGESNRWFFDLDYWRNFLNMMSRNRYNVLTLWHPHPYGQMVRVEKYPEAAELADEELKSNIDFFTEIFSMAYDRGIKVYLITWNIHVSGNFAKAHSIPQDGYDSFLVRDYMKESVKALLRTYPKLTGIGTCAGEAMPTGKEHSYGGSRGEFREELFRHNLGWIRNTYIDAIKETRIVPLIFRHWWSFPEVTQELIAKDYPDQCYIELKYNGEHMYSSPNPHHYNEKWFTQKPRNYKILWQLRNDDLFIFRWGDPSFVKDAMMNIHDTSSGYFQGSDDTGPWGPDLNHSEIHIAHMIWKYLFEKNWFREMLWGRLGYNPNTIEELWKKHFVRRFGPEAGEQAYQALVVSSKILPTTTSFHWNYMNGDWNPEYCTGGWNTGENYREQVIRESSKFHSVIEWIFNHTIEKGWLNISQYVNIKTKGESMNGLITPLDVADRLEKYAKEASQHIENATGKITGGQDEFKCLHMDVMSLAYLGMYYSAKTRGALELMFFLRTGDEKHQEKSIIHLENALEWWDKLSEIASAHYAIPRVGMWGRDRLGGPEAFQWHKHRKDVLRDIEIAKQLRGVEPRTWF